MSETSAGPVSGGGEQLNHRPSLVHLASATRPCGWAAMLVLPKELHPESPPAAPAAPAGPEQAVRLIYVLGSGRCGSTLLDTILGAHPRVQSTGELFIFPKWLPTQSWPCACGLDSSQCPLWSRVRTDFERKGPLARMHDGWRRYEQMRDLPRTIGARAIGSRRLRRHVTDTAGLYRVLAAVTGRDVIVDSSKDPVRGLVCGLLPGEGIDTRFVHLVRDARAFLWSKLSQPDGSGLWAGRAARASWKLALQWVGFNLLSSILFRRSRDRYLRIRYEDLVSDPKGTLRRLGEFLELDLTSVIETVTEGRPIPVSHILGGNRLRFGGEVTLRPDTEWQQLLPSQDERVFWRWTGWLARRYGYHSRTRTRGPGGSAPTPAS
jgi:hypothetical protein